MKFVGYLVLLLMFTNCNAQNKHVVKTITYEAFTRGSSIVLNVTADSLIFKENQKTKEIQLTSKTWKEISALLSKIDVLKMPAFIPPSKNRLVDKALHATLTILIDDKEYFSQIFDHGNPPKELKNLIEKIFEIVN